MPRIMATDSKRERINPQTPARAVPAGARQMRSSASCSSPSTDVAPNSSRTTPKIVAVTLSPGPRTLSSMPCTASAPGAPTRSLSRSKISPRAASSPKNSPAIEITISSSGAIENSV